MIKVLVVDDSSFMRKIIRDILTSHPQIEVVGVARDGEDALEKIKELNPDVVTLDIEMPKLDGLQTLKIIMKQFPRPVIMVSSLTQEGAQATLQALSLGAFDYVTKPSGHISLDMNVVGEELIAKVVAAGSVTPSVLKEPTAYITQQIEQQIRPAKIIKSEPPVIVAIAASTGGPRALQYVLSQLPGDFPLPIVVVQHMPKDFTPSFAKRLDSVSQLTVIEAYDKAPLHAGMAAIAPGGAHLIVKRDKDKRLFCGLSDIPPVLSVKPSANVLFMSLADEVGGKVLSVILTGMGRDGTDGATMLKKKGAYVIAEAQESCVVYGMPRAAVEAGIVDETVPLTSISTAILRYVNN